MIVPDELKPCVIAALKKISRGEITKGKLYSYLTEKNQKREAFPPEIAKRTCLLMEEEGFIDEKRYLKLILEKCDDKLLGPRKIEEELKKRMFGKALIDKALSRELDLTSRAGELLLQRYGAVNLLGTPEGRRKLISYLIRQGYDYSNASAAVDRQKFDE